jgi:hypothetical protein
MKMRDFRAACFLPWAMLVLAAAVPAAADDLTIRIPAAQGVVGAEARIPVLAEKAADLGAVEFDLVYDARLLEFVSLEAGPMNTGMVDSRLVRPGLVRIGSIAEPALSGDGTLFVAAFKVLGSGTGILEIQNFKANAGTTGAELKAAFSAGSISVPEAGGPAVKAGLSSWTSQVPTPMWWIAGGLLGLLLVLLVWDAYLLGKLKAFKSKNN